MKTWSLNSKVAFIVAILAAGAVFISFMGIRNMGSINEGLKDIVTGDVKRDQLTSLVTDSQRQISINVRDIIIERDVEKMAVYETSYNKAHTELLASLDLYTSTASPEGKSFADKYKGVVAKWMDANSDVIKLAKLNKDEEVAVLRETKVAPLVKEMNEVLNSMNALTAKRIEDKMKASQESYESSRFLSISVSLACILCSLGLGIYVLSAVTKSIDQVIANLTDNSNQVTSAAQQIASSSEELSQAATEQAASLEETAASIEEMNSMVQKNADNAKRTSSLTQSSHQKAENGKSVVQDMIKAIDDISRSNSNIMNQIEDSNQKISDIIGVISEIGNKTKVINDIVFQTKLLSFNASVEAARAGEHGKGFAVVAEEVGNLAQMSGNAAKEISAMLDGSIQKVEGIINETKEKVGHLIQDGRAKVEAGTRIANQCGVVLDEIVEDVSNVTQMANEISTACQEQAQGVQEITRAMNQLDQVTQTNAATSEEAASAAEELSSQAESLRSTVGILVQEIKGNHAHVEASSQPRSSATSSHHGPKKKDNVISMKKSAYKAPVEKQAMKKASGGYEGSIPAENDPRFDEV